MDPSPPAEKAPAPRRRSEKRSRREQGRERKRIFSVSVMVAFVIGVLFVAVFNVALAWTSKEEFCLGCHEMKDNAYREYQASVHYTNRSGMRATCSDCHVPKEFFPKILSKVRASKEVWHSWAGTIDTPEKYEAKRGELAQNVWRYMQATDSRECRNCHDPAYFDFAVQRNRAVDRHAEISDNKQTCIDCHKGIVHKLPAGFQADSGVTTTEAAN